MEKYKKKLIKYIENMSNTTFGIYCVVIIMMLCLIVGYFIGKFIYYITN